MRPLALIAALLIAAVAASAGEAVTFIGWSDQHVTVKGDAAHLYPAIEAMNAIEGTEYPPALGGKVAKPAFVMGLGDATEWPTNAAKDAYAEAITRRLKLPSYDILGNHDEGGNAPSDTMRKWILSRHKALSYSFDEGGVHFVMVHSSYDESLNNPAQPIAPAALEFIRADLAKVPAGRPVIVGMHLCFDAMTNREQVVEAMGNANVLFIAGGHYHKATVHEFRGQRFVQFPSPQSTTQFTVVRIENGRIVALPYDYKAKAWVTDARVRLDWEAPPARAR